MPYPISYKKKEILTFKDNDTVNTTELMDLLEQELNNVNVFKMRRTDNVLSFVGPIADFNNIIPNLVKGNLNFENSQNTIIITIELNYYFGTIVLLGVCALTFVLIPNMILKIAGIAIIGLLYYFQNFTSVNSFNIFFYDTLEKYRNGREIYLQDKKQKTPDSTDRR